MIDHFAEYHQDEAGYEGYVSPRLLLFCVIRVHLDYIIIYLHVIHSDSGI